MSFLKETLDTCDTLTESAALALTLSLSSSGCFCPRFPGCGCRPHTSHAHKPTLEHVRFGSRANEGRGAQGRARSKIHVLAGARNARGVARAG